MEARALRIERQNLREMTEAELREDLFIAEEDHNLRVGLDAIHREKERAEIQEWVYFIVCLSEDTPVKVGFSVDPHARLAELQTGSPYELKLVGMLRGGQEVEAAIHKDLAHCHMRGEWFLPDKAMDKYLSRVYKPEQSVKAVQPRVPKKVSCRVDTKRDDLHAVVDNDTGTIYAEAKTHAAAMVYQEAFHKKDRNTVLAIRRGLSLNILRG